ncbi:MAG: zinc-ribbon domain-containing protein, partial [Streptomyces sp.]
MASNCPHCGAPTPDEARFCMKCGRERPRETTVSEGPVDLPPAELGAPTSAGTTPPEPAADAPGDGAPEGAPSSGAPESAPGDKAPEG